MNIMMNSRKLHIDKDLLFDLEQKQEQIGAYLLNCRLDTVDSIGLMDGLAGICLVLSLYYRNTSDEKFLNKLEQTLDTINKRINLLKDIESSYAHGIAGYAWLIIHLKENDLIEINIDNYLSEIDEYLLKNLLLMIQRKEYDTIHAAVGMGFYFLKRKNEEVVGRIIDGLYHDRISINGFTTWSRKNLKTHKEEVDFGLAHGIQGIMIFLYKCYMKHILTQKCSEMVSDNISFIINYMNLSGTPSFFPNTIGCNQIIQHDRKQNWSRLGWCYGDLSALYILFLISSNLPVQIDTINMLEQLAQRRSNGITDLPIVELCHGTTGIAYIFYRLFRKTGKHSFENACYYWIERTLLLEREQEVTSPGLLNGISGVASVFLSFINPDLISWDESIFLT